MQDFTIHLRVDTPCMLGGPSAEMDPTQVLRGPSVRGLLHTFARALIGPLLSQNPRETRDAERRLLGAQGGLRDLGATFRLEPSFDPIALEVPDPHVLPHRGGSTRPAFEAGAEMQLRIQPRPNALSSDPAIAAALWIVVWTAFTFGSLGNRARRGYGSLTIQKASGAPDLKQLLGADSAQELPLFPSLPATATLESMLSDGLSIARRGMHQWLLRQPSKPLSSLAGTAPTATSFFELLSPGHVYIGAAKPNWKPALVGLMNACHQALVDHGGGYRTAMGSAVPDRRSSPLWVRYYRTVDGYVPVATLSPADPNRAPVNQVLTTGLSAGTPTAWRTLR
jgi:hypothetical protein